METECETGPAAVESIIGEPVDNPNMIPAAVESVIGETVDNPELNTTEVHLSQCLNFSHLYRLLFSGCG